MHVLQVIVGKLLTPVTASVGQFSAREKQSIEVQLTTFNLELGAPMQTTDPDPRVLQAFAYKCWS